MRRTVSALMVGVLLMAILEPFAAAAASVATTPACCRRNGKHHCNSSSQTSLWSPEGSSSATVRTVPERCPMRYSVRSTAAAHFVLARHSLTSILATDSSVGAYETVIFLAAGFSSHTDRGPPLEA